jgi:hypothetical protein
MKLYWRSVLRGWGVGLLLVVATVTASAAAEDESGFVLLTGQDGREHWLGYGRDNAQNTWPANWEFVDGVLHAKGGGADLKTREQYGDFDLRFEWKIANKGNSGVMYRVSQEKDPAYFTGPEYQVIDDVGNEDAANLDTCSASIYALYAPEKRLAKPAGEWNEARIVVNGNHVEHFLNGVKAIECEMGSDDWNRRVKASKFDAWKKFGKNSRGYIDLQDHGDQVWYRNVRIKSLDGASQEK